jgi:hypothetical protein
LSGEFPAAGGSDPARASGYNSDLSNQSHVEAPLFSSRNQNSFAKDNIFVITPEIAKSSPERLADIAVTL